MRVNYYVAKWFSAVDDDCTGLRLNVRSSLKMFCNIQTSCYMQSITKTKKVVWLRETTI